MNTHTSPERQVLTSTVLAVVVRVAGPVEVGMTAHGVRHPERPVSVRVGDVLEHLTDAAVAARVRQRWDVGLGAALRLRERVSQTWLRPRPGTYPAAVSVELTRLVEVSSRFVPADQQRRRPPYLEVRVDQVAWQVCDLTAWRAIGDAWLAAQQQRTDVPVPPGWISSESIHGGGESVQQELRAMDGGPAVKARHHRLAALRPLISSSAKRSTVWASLHSGGTGVGKSPSPPCT